MAAAENGGAAGPVGRASDHTAAPSIPARRCGSTFQVPVSPAAMVRVRNDPLGAPGVIEAADGVEHGEIGLPGQGLEKAPRLRRMLKMLSVAAEEKGFPPPSRRLMVTPVLTPQAVC